MKNKLLDLHKKYNDIATLQSKLPNTRGKRDYSEIESEITIKARELNLRCQVLLMNVDLDRSHKQEIENIQEGVKQIEKNPYLKITGVIDLD